jgi:anhydro-N-acetylmuramic acid kinase
MQRLKVIGLMSGTSFDGIDVAMLDTDGQDIHTIYPSYMHNYSREIQNKISHLIKSGSGSLEEIAHVSNLLTTEHAQAVSAFITYHNIDITEVDLIGFHGQTIFHKPDIGVTWQLGNPALLAELLQKTVVADFRSADVAAGGQGAPLVPIYHQAILCDIPYKPIAVVNIGGVSNITWISENELLAFDVGPGNALINDEIYDIFGLPR